MRRFENDPVGVDIMLETLGLFTQLLMRLQQMSQSFPDL